jgi:hypothetical protein
MKKYLILAALTTISFTLKAQDTPLNIPLIDNKIIYQDTISIKNVTKKQLFIKAKQWLTDNYRTYKTTIENEDLEYSHISGLGLVHVETSTIGIPRTLRDKFTIQFDFKDGKYRYKIYDFFIREGASIYKAQNLNDIYAKFQGTGSAGFSKSQCKDLILSNDVEVKKLITSLTNAMDTDDSF